MAEIDTCVCCGEEVPEGRQVCPSCDVVAVVRCKDCKHLNLFTCPLSYIEKHELIFINKDPEFYCGYGERK